MMMMPFLLYICHVGHVCSLDWINFSHLIRFEYIFFNHHKTFIFSKVMACLICSS
jgi:hypothetical protein